MAFDLDDEELEYNRRMNGLVRKGDITVAQLKLYIKDKLKISEDFKKFVLDDLNDIPDYVSFNNKMIVDLFERAIFSYSVVRLQHLNVDIHEKNIEKFFKNLEDEILLK